MHLIARNQSPHTCHTAAHPSAMLLPAIAARRREKPSFICISLGVRDYFYRRVMLSVSAGVITLLLSIPLFATSQLARDETRSGVCFSLRSVLPGCAPYEVLYLYAVHTVRKDQLTGRLYGNDTVFGLLAFVRKIPGARMLACTQYALCIETIDMMSTLSVWTIPIVWCVVTEPGTRALLLLTTSAEIEGHRKNTQDTSQNVTRDSERDRNKAPECCRCLLNSF